MNDFCRKKREGLRSSKAHLYRTFTWSPPELKHGSFLLVKSWHLLVDLFMSFLRFLYWLQLPSDVHWSQALWVNISVFLVVLRSVSQVWLWRFLTSQLFCRNFQSQASWKMKSLFASVLVFAFCISEGMNYLLFCHVSKHLSPVVQTLENAIHRIKIYPGENVIGFSKGGFPLPLNV